MGGKGREGKGVPLTALCDKYHPEVTHPKQHKSFFGDNVIEQSHCTYNPLDMTPLDVT